MGTGHVSGPHGPGPDDPVTAYRLAVDRLTAALVEVWVACEQNVGAGSSGSGLNLPEALSYALGRAARSLGLDPGSIEAEERRNDDAAEGLVRHRPGSWEAAALRPLVFPVAWLPDPAGQDHTGVEL
jgi:hypothetical protein